MPETDARASIGEALVVAAQADLTPHEALQGVEQVVVQESRRDGGDDRAVALPG